MSNKADLVTMNQETKRELKPKLRFPEFHGGWGNQRLGEIAVVITEKAGNKKYTLMSITSGVGLVTQMEKFGREIAGSQYKNYLVIRENDFAYNKSATKECPEGFIAIYSGTEAAAVPKSIFTCFRVQDNRVFPQYLNYLFLGNLHGKWLRKFITVGARAHGSLNVDNEDLLSLPVPLPEGSTSLNEQQKIAGCLSSLDDRLAAETQKLGTLKDHKKGLMQQLFPAEGETLPKLRFPEFGDAGEWEVRKLGELLLNRPDYGVNAAAVTYSGALPAYLRITDISDEGYYLCEKKVSVDIEAKDENYLNEGDIVLTRTGASVGKSYKYRKEDGKLVFAGFLIRIKPDQKKIDSTFLSNYISTKQYWNWVSANSARSGQPGINGNEYATLPVPIPPSEKDLGRLSEQQKISDCLSSIDELITAQTQKINTLKVHKKGLMQQLFPALDEVKG